MNQFLFIYSLLSLVIFRTCYGYLLHRNNGIEMPSDSLNHPIFSNNIKSNILQKYSLDGNSHYKYRNLIQRGRSLTALAAAPRVEIEYCTGCRWMLRSAWLAQELLTTFEQSIGEVALIPSRPKDGKGGTFTIRVDDKLIWDRKNPETPGFPEVKQVKQLVRDIIAPEKDLGHSDINQQNQMKSLVISIDDQGNQNAKE